MAWIFPLIGARHLRHAGILLSAALWLAPAPATAAYRFMGFPSAAYGISGDGETAVGYATFFPLPGAHAARVETGGPILNLGVLPGWAGSSAEAASTDGSHIVGTLISSGPTIQEQAFRWTSGSGYLLLGTLSGGTSSGATDVSGDGEVVVGWSETAGGIEAFRWTSGGSMVGLGFLTGGTESRAHAVSDDGTVVVGECTTPAGVEAFIWTSGGGMVGLGDLPGGLFGSAALDVSGDGSTVVGYSYSAASGTTRPEAFRWTSGGGMVGLGDLPGGFFSSTARAVSFDGTVVVGESNVFGLGPDSDQAFHWTDAAGMQPLNDVVLALGLPIEPGDFIESARGISDDGSVVVGLGSSDFNLGDEEGWILDLSAGPSLPALGGATAAALGLAMLCSGCRALSRRPSVRSAEQDGSKPA